VFVGDLGSPPGPRGGSTGSTANRSGPPRSSGLSPALRCSTSPWAARHGACRRPWVFPVATVRATHPDPMNAAASPAAGGTPGAGDWLAAVALLRVLTTCWPAR